MSRFPVLMFHRIASDTCPVISADERRYSVALTAFEAQLDAMVAARMTGVSMDRVHEQLQRGEIVPDDWVAITFDDGNRSDYEHALPLLVDRGFSATFYVCGNRVDSPDGLDANMITEMHNSGLHIGSHTMTHRFLTDLSPADEEEELRGSRDLLSEITGESIDLSAPPGGRIGRRAFATLSRLGYRAVATSRFGFNRATGPRVMYRRIPVVERTSLRLFGQILRHDRIPLLPAYLRSFVLNAARGTLGERGYDLLRQRALSK